MYKDYTNYDYLSVSVKSDRLERILSCYSSLGWRVVKREDDRQYYNMQYFVLRRPHKIENKDRLQYLQVRMENTLNAISLIISKKHAKSTALCALLSVLTLVFCVAGLWLMLGLGQTLGFITGIISFSAAGAALIGIMLVLLVLRRREERAARARIDDNTLLLYRLIAEAELLAPEYKEDKGQIKPLRRPGRRKEAVNEKG